MITTITPASPFPPDAGNARHREGPWTVEMVRRRLPILAAVAVVALLATGCSTKKETGSKPLTTVVATTLSPPPADTTAPETSMTSDADGSEGPDTSISPDSEVPATPSFTPLTANDRVLARALADLEDYWSVVFPELYGDAWEPISGGYYPYTSYSDLPPCPGVQSYGDVAENAFYCPAADLVAWDAENLVPEMQEQFGDFALAIVMAHEIGHAVQSRARFGGTFTVTKEQQADCFAGAWVASVANGHSKRFSVELEDLDASVAGFLQLRDHPGADGLEAGAHGSAFDRVGSFQDGFEKGAKACKDYSDQNVAERLVELPFDSADEAASNGNLRWEEVLPLVSADLESFWSTVFTQAGRTWVPIDPTLRADGTLARQMYDTIGDFAAATLLGRAYAAQVQEVLEEGGTPLQQSLQADCLTGSWAASMFLQDRPDRTLQMSPGDLDKAVLALLVSSDRGGDVRSGNALVGTAFQRISALRAGFMDGIAECGKITLGT